MLSFEGLLVIAYYRGAAELADSLVLSGPFDDGCTLKQWQLPSWVPVRTNSLMVAVLCFRSATLENELLESTLHELWTFIR